MSIKKLKGSDLKRIIEEVMNEDTIRIIRKADNSETDDQKWFSKLGISRNDADDIATKVGADGSNTDERLGSLRDFFNDEILGLDGDDKDLTNLDMDMALGTNKKGNVYKAAERVSTSSRGPWKDYKQAGNIDNLSKDAQGATIGTPTFGIYEPETITKPRLYTAPSDAGASQFLGSQNELVLSIFKKNTIAERLKELDILTNNIFYSDEWYETNKNNARTMLQAMMMADLITHMSKEISGYSGDGFFEAFCALICGGSVSGTEMGAADFETADGKHGSSKYYQKYSNMGQAVSNFNKQRNEVHYVIAIKTGGEQASAVVATSPNATTKANEITYIDLHYIIVKLVSQKDGKKNFTLYNSVGDVLSTQNGKKDGQSIVLEADHDPKDTYVGALRLEAGGVPWREAFERNMKDGSAKQAFAASKEFFKELFAAEEQTKIYIAKDQSKGAQSIINSGNAALSAFDKADTHLTSLVNLLSGGKKVQGNKGSRQLKEQKITAKVIQKLIQEKLRE